MLAPVEFTNQNHFKFGYDDQWFSNRVSKNQQWNCSYGKISEVGLNVKEANKRAARLIYQNAQKLSRKVCLLLSGGSDSEVAARAFLDAQVPFTAVMLEYGKNEKDVDNHFELQYANILVQKYQIPSIRIKLDLGNFWSFDNTEFVEIAHLTQCTSPQLITTMWLARQIHNKHNGYVVLGQGEPLVYRQFDQWWFREKELIGSWAKFWCFDKINGTSGFHQYTPEQMLAYLTDPIVVEFIKDPAKTNPDPVGIFDNAMIKHLLYQTHYPDSELVNRKKYTGFENQFWIEWQIRGWLREIFPYNTSEFTIEYNKMISNLRGSKSS